MSSKTKFVIGGAVSAIILVVLFFIPVNEFSSVDSFDSESPPPIVVLTNYHEDFEITPTSCKPTKDTVEFEFSIQNNLDDDYYLELELALFNENDQDLSREAILVQIEAGQTIHEKHQTFFNPDMKSCVIELDRIERMGTKKMGSEIFFTLQGDDSVGTINGEAFEAGPKMTYVSVSQDGDLILATSSASDIVFAFDSKGNKLSEIPVGKTPKGVKIHPTKDIAFVANENSGTLSIIDLINLNMIKEIKIGKIPHNIVFHPNGSTAYVTIQGGDEIAVVDVSDLKKIDVIQIGNLPHNLDVTPDGKRLFVTNIGTNDVSVIDLSTKDLIKRIPISKGHHGIDIPPFGDRVFVSGIGDDKVSVIDTTSLEVIDQIIVGQGPHGLRSDFESNQLYVGVTQTNEIVVIDIMSLEIIERLSPGNSPFWIAVAGNS